MAFRENWGGVIDRAMIGVGRETADRHNRRIAACAAAKARATLENAFSLSAWWTRSAADASRQSIASNSAFGSPPPMGSARRAARAAPIMLLVVGGMRRSEKAETSATKFQCAAVGK